MWRTEATRLSGLPTWVRLGLGLLRCRAGAPRGEHDYLLCPRCARRLCLFLFFPPLPFLRRERERRPACRRATMQNGARRAFLWSRRWLRLAFLWLRRWLRPPLPSYRRPAAVLPPLI